MKACFLFISVTAALCVLTMALAGIGPDAQTPADREVGELRKQVDELRARVKVLEERSSRLESVTERLERWRQLPETPTPAPPGTPNGALPFLKIPPDEGRQPKIWGEREVNGWTFYLIPCLQQPSPLVQREPLNFK